MEWFLKVVRDNYANFSGRARRQEYWMFTLFSILFSIALAIVDNVLGFTYGQGSGLLGTVYSLAILIPSIAVGVRRLHDVNKSGWMLLIAFIPLIGAIWLIVLFATEGDSGSNQYGSDPKTGSGAALNDDLLDEGFIKE
ncbi:MAG: DUF805 domain-containing protein [Putridiphycobacter sp.]|nr:DUF805 domain-containing protein [Putridiphycobacter sp.]